MNDTWVREIASGVPLATYINKFCLMDIPRFQYFPVFVTAFAFSLTFPHILWKAYFDAKFQSFFTVAKELSLHEHELFRSGNVDCVKTLESKFGKQKSIYISYIVKLLLQLLVSIGGICIAWAVFTEVSHTFTCPSSWSNDGYTEGWPLNTNVTCVYTSAQFFRLFQAIVTVFMIASFIFLLLGLLWCAAPHSDLECISGPLSDSEIIDGPRRDRTSSVNFSRLTYLPPELYQPPKTFLAVYGLMIRNDLRFLILLLYQSDFIIGTVFNTILLRIHLFYFFEEMPFMYSLLGKKKLNIKLYAKHHYENILMTFLSQSYHNIISLPHFVTGVAGKELEKILRRPEMNQCISHKKSGFMVLNVIWDNYRYCKAIDEWLRDVKDVVVCEELLYLCNFESSNQIA